MTQLRQRIMTNYSSTDIIIILVIYYNRHQLVNQLILLYMYYV